MMTVDLWDHSVELTIENSDHFRRVGSSREAMQCLLTCWPVKSGKWFTVARKRCLQSIEGKLDHGAAEAAFKKAAAEAGILRP
jgi:hypothetical protein